MWHGDIVPWLAGAAAAASVAVGVAALSSSQQQKPTQEELDECDVSSSPWKGSTFLVLVNPVSGGRRGLSVYSDVVEPLCKRAGVSIECIVTSHENHAFEVARDQDLSPYSAVLLASGDGMVSQFLNGLSARFPALDREAKKHDLFWHKDSVAALSQFSELLGKTCLGVIPVGTCNGLSSSFAGREPLPAVCNILQHSANEVDVTTIHSQSGKLRWDMHNVSWGIIADHDELTERHLRWMGSLRKHYAPLHVIAKCASYRGRISFKPVEFESEKQRIEQHYTDPNRKDILQSSEHPKFFVQQQQRAKAACTTSAEAELPSLSDVHGEASEWRYLEGEFIMFASMNTSAGATDAIVAPHAVPGEGAVDILVMRAGVGRWGVLQMFLAFETGKHIEMPFVDVFKVSEYVLEPEGEGTMTASGEFLGCEPIHVKVHPKKLRFAY